MPLRAVHTMWRDGGITACARKVSAAARMTIPRLLRRRRTAASTGAYFDLVTDDSRRFYGDSFHFGYFPCGDETLSAAHQAHTDLVAELAELAPNLQVLDIGCGIAAPALRMARVHGCRLTGINISREQIRQGRRLIAAAGMTDRITIDRGDALRLPYGDHTFDAIVCLEVAGDVCITAADKHALLRGMFRVLRPGGTIGFTDFALHTPPNRHERRVLRSVFYDDGSQLATDWPALFSQHGFLVEQQRCVIDNVLLTWDRIRDLYAGDDGELRERYGAMIARHIRGRIERVPPVLRRIGTFPVLRARKPAGPWPPERCDDGKASVRCAGAPHRWRPESS